MGVAEEGEGKERWKLRKSEKGLRSEEVTLARDGT